jgi:hypothetical protein
MTPTARWILSTLATGRAARHEASGVVVAPHATSEALWVVTRNGAHVATYGTPEAAARRGASLAV